jgi:hypothetical protein
MLADPDCCGAGAVGGERRLRGPRSGNRLLPIILVVAMPGGDRWETARIGAKHPLI